MATVTTYKMKLVVLAIIIGTFGIIAVQRWLLQNEFANSFSLRNKEANSSITAKQNKTNHNSKVILFYTRWFGRLNWPGIARGAEINVSCGEQTCRFTHNRDELQRSDAVMFHGRDLPSETVLKEVAKCKPPKQRWVYHQWESPVNAGRNPALFNGMFNWTMTYRVGSDLYVPYVAPCKGIQESLGFWIPHCGFRIPGTGFRIPAQWIPDSQKGWIPNFFVCVLMLFFAFPFRVRIMLF